MNPAYHSYNLIKIRQAIPALLQTHHCHPVIYLNGPGGTQVPRCVPEAMSHYLLETNSNLGAPFSASIKTGKIMEEARRAAAAFFNARDWREISFGQNMTSVVFNFSRALSNTWQPGDNIILTELDHDSNVSPWVMAAREKGVEIRYWPVNLEGMTLDLEDLEPLLDSRTRLLAVTMASNLVGSIINIKEAVRIAKQVEAHVFIDVTHACAHLSIDVQELGCDSMACSAYKFSGPHLGILYGRLEVMQLIPAYKVPHAADLCPSKWEQGTQNFEALAGLVAILKYKAGMAGNGDLTTANLHAAMQMIFNYERKLIQRFLEGLSSFPALAEWDRYGLFNVGTDVNARTPTFSFRIPGQTPEETTRWFAEEGVFTASGHFHCSGVINKLGLDELGGVWRLGFAYYTTIEEIDRLLEKMNQYAQSARVLNSTCILTQ